jgi:CubicO group peptidase (beta-lactamase class C family)
MLYGDGKADMAAYAASKSLIAEPDTVCEYSSGTSLILSALAGRAVGGGADGFEAFLRRELFDPIGMVRAVPKFDGVGTWIGSTYCFDTAREFAKFGLLYLRDGVWDGLRLLPPGWVDHGRRQRSWDPVDQVGYGAHWWTTGDRHGTFRAAGYEGQMIVVSPALDLIVVRLGKTDAVHKADLAGWRAAMVDAFR